jgi:hypothetical protein
MNSIQAFEVRRAGSVDRYLRALKAQAEVAKAFYFGHVAEGLAGYEALPEDVRLQIDQLIWEASFGKSEVSPRLVAEAIMYSIEMRMGMSE